MRHLPRALSVVLLLSIGLKTIAAQQGTPRDYRCEKVESPPNIDGRLNDPAWRRAPWSGEFVDIEGDVRPKPRFRTRMKMLWDDRYLYVAAEMEEPDVWATLTEHDSVIFRDNDFEVFLDPGGKGIEYFEFEINALNTGWDLYLAKPYRKGGKADNGWEIPGLRTAVQVRGTLNQPGDRDRGWTVEMAFPWDAFRGRAQAKFPPVEGDVWRVNFSRVQWRSRPDVRPKNEKEDNWVWSPQGIVDMHLPEHWGYVRFVGR